MRLSDPIEWAAFKTANTVCEMRLCETARVFLKPDTLYRFTVDPECDRCVLLAAGSQGYVAVLCESDQ